MRSIYSASRTPSPVPFLSRKLIQTTATAYSTMTNPVSTGTLNAWKTQAFKSDKNRLAQAAISRGNFQDMIIDRSALNKNIGVFNTQIQLEGSPITYQRSSGRCWIFASLNVLRIELQQKLKIPEFQFSQTYLFFYDKLEKSNWFLDNVMDTASEDLDSRLVQELLKEPVNDGGQFDMIINLVEKYGLVPLDVFPDSWNSENSRNMCYLITEKLREYALVLRELVKEGKKDQAVAMKSDFLQEIHTILCITLGTPPAVDEKFTWDFKTRDKVSDSKELEVSAKKVETLSLTPVELYQLIGIDFKKYFSLINDPRNDYNQRYTVDRLNNVAGGAKAQVDYVNTDISELKKAAIKALQNNEAVFFGSDVGKFGDRKSGVLDNEAWDYDLGFNTTMKLTKKQRLQTGSSMMTHAMAITAVHLDAAGKPVRWRIENSWGKDNGKDGYYQMSDAWFDEYVFQVVTCDKYVDAQLLDILKQEPKVLPLWDPMGALARL